MMNQYQVRVTFRVLGGEKPVKAELSQIYKKSTFASLKKHMSMRVEKGEIKSYIYKESQEKQGKEIKNQRDYRDMFETSKNMIPNIYIYIDQLPHDIFQGSKSEISKKSDNSEFIGDIAVKNLLSSMSKQGKPKKVDVNEKVSQQWGKKNINDISEISRRSVQSSHASLSSTLFNLDQNAKVEKKQKIQEHENQYNLSTIPQQKLQQTEEFQVMCDCDNFKLNRQKRQWKCQKCDKHFKREQKTAKYQCKDCSSFICQDCYNYQI